MERLNNFSEVSSSSIVEAAEKYGTPLYFYDEKFIKDRCSFLLTMPNAFGLTVRFAMKSNSTKAILRTIYEQGLEIDASSFNEVIRAHMAGIAYEKIMLTSQEVPLGEDRKALEDMILQGLRYNVCSLRQLELIGDFAATNNISLAMRVHPGVGSGESASRNTGDNYSCFGVHLSDLDKAIEYAKQKGIRFFEVHVHIGSGGDPVMWRENIDRELDIIEKYFPDAETVSFGGGLKEARMPGDISADVKELGEYAKKRIEAFNDRTGRKLKMEVEPGTYTLANAGYIVTQILDIKRTGDMGMNFLVVDGGMELNSRPLLYGSHHPFYLVSQNGKLLSSEFDLENNMDGYSAAVVGRCCESGDAQSLDDEGKCFPRLMAQPETGDYVVIGGAGAYCSTMSPYNYNSHEQAPEVMMTEEGTLVEIRKKQTLEQIVANEL